MSRHTMITKQIATVEDLQAALVEIVSLVKFSAGPECDKCGSSTCCGGCREPEPKEEEHTDLCQEKVTYSDGLDGCYRINDPHDIG